MDIVGNNGTSTTNALLDMLMTAGSDDDDDCEMQSNSPRPMVSMSTFDAEMVQRRHAGLDRIIAYPDKVASMNEERSFVEFKRNKPAVAYIHHDTRMIMYQNFYGGALRTDNTLLDLPPLHPEQRPWERVEIWSPGMDAPWSSLTTMNEYHRRLGQLQEGYSIMTSGNTLHIDPMSDIVAHEADVPDKRRRMV